MPSRAWHLGLLQQYLPDGLLPQIPQEDSTFLWMQRWWRHKINTWVLTTATLLSRNTGVWASRKPAAHLPAPRQGACPLASLDGCVRDGCVICLLPRIPPGPQPFGTASLSHWSPAGEAIGTKGPIRRMSSAATGPGSQADIDLVYGSKGTH